MLNLRLTEILNNILTCKTIDEDVFTRLSKDLENGYPDVMKWAS